MITFQEIIDESIVGKFGTVYWHSEPYVTADHPIPIKCNDIDFDTTNFSRNVGSKTAE